MDEQKFYELFDLDEQEAYVLPIPTLKRVSDMMRLVVQSGQLPDQTRYVRSKEYGFTDLIMFEEEVLDDAGQPTQEKRFRVKDPDLTMMDYVVQSAQLLFPKAPVAEKKDDLNVEVVMEAVSDFLSAVQKNRGGGTNLSDFWSRLAQT